MKQKIVKIVSSKPGLLGREIAKVLCVDKKEVNSLLARDSAGLYQDKDTYRWYPLSTKQHVLKFEADTWICEKLFENNFQESGCFFASDSKEFVILFPEKCKILLIAGARIIALANQCIYHGKSITLDFSRCPKTKDYLDRLGFFDHLSSKVTVIPGRPTESKAKKYSGNSDNIVEIASIDLSSLDESIPVTLTEAFIKHAGEDYRSAALMIYSELFNNVHEHSLTPIHGFAALQYYGGHKRHIQTVVSDSGKGILATLKPQFHVHYPKLAAKFDFNDRDSGIALLTRAFTKGGLSQFGSNPEGRARGLGLKRSQDYALKYNAEITVRQENFELKLTYKNSKLHKATPKFDLPIIYGTQVCFDFFLV